MTASLQDSSDSLRSAKPLRYVQTAHLADPLQLEHHAVLQGVIVAYETYGQLNAAKNNAILVCHALSGDSHVARHNETDDPGWWDLVVGPGKAIDTDQYFVVCSNLLGGCRGTTGPGSINLETGKPYGQDFPTITLNDMVEVQRRLMDHLGIQRWRSVVGGSLGGHQALTWAIQFPHRVQGVVALATSPRLTSQALAFDVVGRNAIRQDPHFCDGQYYEHQGPEVGLAIARMIGHITYLSGEAMAKKFDFDRLHPRQVATEFEKVFSVGSYLGYQGDKFVERFDANSYIAISMAMDLFDLGSSRQALAAALQPATCRWLVLSFSSDWLFPSSQSRDLVNALIANRTQVSYCDISSQCGHDAFLLADELASYGEMIRGFLGQLDPKAPGCQPSQDDEAYETTSIFRQHRLDYERIGELIPAGSSVLDLGCGSGALLARLKQGQHGPLVGLERDESSILAGIRKGLDVIQADLNQGLAAFADDQFDFVVLSQTLQAIDDVEGIIREMLRVGRTGIVSFPNFAFRRLRKMLAEEGRAPKSTGVLCYEWYNTPNRRFLSIADFEEFCQQKRIKIHRTIPLNTEEGIEVLDNPNLDADLAIFAIGRGEGYVERGVLHHGEGI